MRSLVCAIAKQLLANRILVGVLLNNQTMILYDNFAHYYNWTSLHMSGERDWPLSVKNQ
jgi:hypothetical protein